MMGNLHDVGAHVQKILLWAVVCAAVLSIAGGVGFFSIAYDAHANYPKWALYVQRIATYVSVATLACSFVACIIFPRRRRSLALLVVSYFIIGTSLFLTEGDPFPVHEKREIHVITDNTQEAKGK